MIERNGKALSMLCTESVGSSVIVHSDVGGRGVVYVIT